MKICLFRLSALGDVTHTLSVVRRIQDQRPDAQITWIIGRLEQQLLHGLEGVEFIVFNKADGVGAYRELRRTLRGRRFDVLLHMQVALRANLASLLVRADRRIGYDHERSRDLHGLFVGERIAAGNQQHVLDAMQSFLEPLGIGAAAPRWNLPLSSQDFAFADEHVQAKRRTLCISPVSSHKIRNWNVVGYAKIADRAAREHNMRVILTGGPSDFERQINYSIEEKMETVPLNLTGKDTLKQLAALLGRCDLLLAPDTGPMHIANAMGTDVLGLHAASNPRRSGPYSSYRWCVDRYDAAARKFLNRPADQIRWGKKIERAGVMDLISVDHVAEKLDEWASQNPG
jgi:heptosyltransferase I